MPTPSTYLFDAALHPLTARRGAKAREILSREISGVYPDTFGWDVYEGSKPETGFPYVRIDHMGGTSAHWILTPVETELHGGGVQISFHQHLGALAPDVRERGAVLVGVVLGAMLAEAPE
jgi:hypothetical protein